MLLLLLSCFSRVRLCATLWTAAHQAPLSTGFSRQEYWSGLPFSFPNEEQEMISLVYELSVYILNDFLILTAILEI